MQLTEDLKKILDIGIALTSEQNYTQLLEDILKEAMDISNSDGGTLYLKEPDGLKFMIMRNNSMNIYQGGNGEKVDMPKVPFSEENVCAYSAIHNQIINIEDVYTSNIFNFSGPKKYDSITGYRTQSMMVIPLINKEGETLGVIQLINAMDKDGKVTAYHKSSEYIVNSIASQASVTLANMFYVEEIKGLLYSVVSVLTTAIDEASKYNARHTYNVANTLEKFARHINLLYKKGKTTIYFNEHHIEEMRMAALLHDIGKIAVPQGILDKATRLETRIDLIMCRLDLIIARTELDYKNGRFTYEEWIEKQAELEECKENVKQADTTGFLQDDLYQKLKKASHKSYESQDHEKIPYITEEESNNLLVRKGTLTMEERKIIEGHVVKTTHIIEKIRFGDKFKNVEKWASGHHEYLDGTGYPRHLYAEDLPIETRMLTIIDIFDALISDDRPYKKAHTVQNALVILGHMVEEGKLDGQLVEYFTDMMEGESND